MPRGNKRPENSERVEFKLGEKDIASRLRGNKRPEQQESRIHTRRDKDHIKRQQEISEQWESRAQTRRERAGLFLPLDAISFWPGLIMWSGNERTSKQGNARLQNKQITWEGNENYITGYIHHSTVPQPSDISKTEHLHNLTYKEPAQQVQRLTSPKINCAETISIL